ncbi:hypothetical protein LPW26_16605 [Rhodopseudomonas sp. HC1]|uniref:hypothetical protein n=1 Tax=Rhodopseudomonas infernalis TaxID=2897386 RepID=UPI001EE810F0|nr:hypothetical protein [Rhodopseudomonas infernalis]MCG6206272.1 hypothetical protein [Rhodopseudomonas infernalis]
MLDGKRLSPVHVMIPSVQLRSGLFVSVLAHLGLVAAVLLLAEVRPFAEVPEQRVEVDVVTADEAPPEPAPKPEIKPALELPTLTPTEAKPAASEPTPPQASKPEPAKPEPAKAEPPKPAQAEPERAKPEPIKPDRQARQTEAPAKPDPAVTPTPPSAVPQTAPPQSAMPTAFPPAIAQEPDLTVKYSVALGLPADPTFDAPAELAADISADAIAALRQKLKTCAALPPGVAPTDNVKIILRVPLLPDGRLAQEPFLIEASASAKGPALMKGAIHALTACQPYSMLPADKYKEWKVLDLDFTPQNFRGG